MCPFQLLLGGEDEWSRCGTTPCHSAEDTPPLLDHFPLALLPGPLALLVETRGDGYDADLHGERQDFERLQGLGEALVGPPHHCAGECCLLSDCSTRSPRPRPHLHSPGPGLRPLQAKVCADERLQYPATVYVVFGRSEKLVEVETSPRRRRALPPAFLEVANGVIKRVDTAGGHAPPTDAPEEAGTARLGSASSGATLASVHSIDGGDRGEPAGLPRG